MEARDRNKEMDSETKENLVFFGFNFENFPLCGNAICISPSDAVCIHFLSINIINL